MLRFLTEHGFANIAALGGWYAYSGGPLSATLGILQEFVRNGEDGWELALAEIGSILMLGTRYECPPQPGMPSRSLLACIFPSGDPIENATPELHPFAKPTDYLEQNYWANLVVQSCPGDRPP